MLQCRIVLARHMLFSSSLNALSKITRIIDAMLPRNSCLPRCSKRLLARA
jgi:hypothetical protein